MANATTGPLSSAPRADDDALPQTDLVKNVLNDVRETAREQLNAAWQIEIERVQEQLAAGWREHIERVFEERFVEPRARGGVEFRAGVRSAVRDTAAPARPRGGGKANQAGRRAPVFENR